MLYDYTSCIHQCSICVVVYIMSRSNTTLYFILKPQVDDIHVDTDRFTLDLITLLVYLDFTISASFVISHITEKANLEGD